jgi:hypothetical protein
MTDDGRDLDGQVDLEGQVLPARELMSLINPGGGSVPGLGGVLGGDPTAAAPSPSDTPAGNPADLASHAADGQSAGAPSVSDQPQDLAPTSTQTAASDTSG